jgi:ABC-type transport system substrate-binding protein
VSILPARSRTSKRARPTGLPSKYGPGSKAAKAGHQQYFVSAANAIRYLHMNASRPLFANARLRRAVNYAIDRRAMAAQGRKFALSFWGGGLPTGDYLPPSITGARDFHQYPLRPDLRRAKRLAGHLHATAILYAASTPPWPQEAEIIRRNLRPLGIDVQVKEFPVGDFFARFPRRGEPWDLAVSGWAFGSTDPSEVLSKFDGSTIGSPNNHDLSYLNDPAFNRKLKAAERLSGAKRYRVFSRLAFDLERDDAPVAAIATGANLDFFSARMGCQLYQPVYGIDIAALCVRR